MPVKTEDIKDMRGYVLGPAEVIVGPAKQIPEPDDSPAEVEIPKAETQHRA